MLLKNFDYATKYFDYISKTEIVERSNQKIVGWYKYINGILSAILVIENKLYFLYGKDIFFISESTRVDINQNNFMEHEFVLIIENKEKVKFRYLIPNDKLNISPFEYIDDDDFKWGDFIAKIVNNKERQENFIKVMCGGSI